MVSVRTPTSRVTTNGRESQKSTLESKRSSRCNSFAVCQQSNCQVIPATTYNDENEKTEDKTKNPQANPQGQRNSFAEEGRERDEANCCNEPRNTRLNKSSRYSPARRSDCKLQGRPSMQVQICVLQLLAAHEFADHRRGRAAPPRQASNEFRVRKVERPR